MDKIIITGGAKLSGDVSISGAKNSALPIIFSTLLCEGKHLISNIPDLVDVKFSLKILESLGSDFEFNAETSKLSVLTPKKNSAVAEYDLVRKMRASILVLGPLLSRYGYGKVSLPGGCAIGTRPIDMHLKAFEEMGAKITLKEGYVVAECERLKGSDIHFATPSVGATENVLMAATLAEGETVIHNAAREPEIVDLGNYLKTLGASIEGLGTSIIKIKGKDSLSVASVEHSIIDDRIEAGTFIVAALMTKSDIQLTDCNPKNLTAFLNVLVDAGATIEQGDAFIKVFGSQLKTLKAVKVITAPYPGFPTDLQAQLMTLLTQAEGVSIIEESIFENRFMHVQELVRLGAKIKTTARVAEISGPTPLSGAPVMATDLRASASLVVAGLSATGVTEVSRIYHLDRGYEKIGKKVALLGGNLERVST